ncbi:MULTISPECIES: hypothetical protein [Paenibacillus]|jgi:hypothetical protein|uniref:Uncharacterized protein n=1 Tax=Paenibacillus phytohabitans TaxID=2654978 RepID=A0ABX1YJ53_9BACL|nr:MULTISPECIES: hypothetical protein [Paenibacillus]NOU79729.1 hypothetical protein [Paenibacillus phytohabitans]
MKNMKNAVSVSSSVRRSEGGNGNSAGGKGRSRRKSGTKLSPSALNVYLAPSLEGGDDEYKKLVSGKVDNNKPSFA